MLTIRDKLTLTLSGADKGVRINENLNLMKDERPNHSIPNQTKRKEVGGCRKRYEEVGGKSPKVPRSLVLNVKGSRVQRTKISQCHIQIRA